MVALLHWRASTWTRHLLDRWGRLCCACLLGGARTATSQSTSTHNEQGGIYTRGETSPWLYLQNPQILSARCLYVRSHHGVGACRTNIDRPTTPQCSRNTPLFFNLRASSTRTHVLIHSSLEPPYSLIIHSNYEPRATSHDRTNPINHMLPFPMLFPLHNNPPPMLKGWHLVVCPGRHTYKRVLAYTVWSIKGSNSTSGRTVQCYMVYSF